MEGLVAKAGDILLSHGLVGVLIMMMAWAIWDLGRKLNTSNEKLHEARQHCAAEVAKAWNERFADYKSTHESLTVLSGMVGDVVEVTKERTSVIATSTKAQEMSAAEITRLALELVRTRETVIEYRAIIENMTREISRLREALVTHVGVRPNG